MLRLPRLLTDKIHMGRKKRVAAEAKARSRNKRTKEEWVCLFV